MRRYLVVVLACFAMTFGNAQNKIKFGINAGLTYSSFRGNPMVEDFNAGFSYLTGVSLEYFLKDNLSLKGNLNYERKTAAKTFYLTSVYMDPSDPAFSTNRSFKQKLNYDYLVLPLLVNYYVNGKKDLYISGGCFTGYLLKSTIASKGYRDEDTTDLDTKIDMGLVFGLGKKFKLNDKNEIGVELRENLGLVNTSDVEVYRNGSIKTNAVNLIATWNFDI
ncbi:porin family protein [Flavobacterium humi]|uniref:PorT family protein n=1 Tax=Flavobacterium humi TaxID=2562683 RepID=A0A4Z0LBZ8_9FLAO|nr:porin family protein [Flavobacterium humi]TGD59406.1 PorT family protein [Flavobacterium humi]